MAANTSPIFTLLPVQGFVKLPGSANTKSDGTGTIGTDLALLYTLDSNGNYLDYVSFIAVATAAATAMTASCLRVFLSTKTSGSCTGGTDTWLLGEITGGTPTVDNSTTQISIPNLVQISKGYGTGYSILVSQHVAPASNTFWEAEFLGGKY